jgi:hypothetical protein
MKKYHFSYYIDESKAYRYILNLDESEQAICDLFNYDVGVFCDYWIECVEKVIHTKSIWESSGNFMAWEIESERSGIRYLYLDPELHDYSTGDLLLMLKEFSKLIKRIKIEKDNGPRP